PTLPLHDALPIYPLLLAVPLDAELDTTFGDVEVLGGRAVVGDDLDAGLGERAGELLRDLPVLVGHHTPDQGHLAAEVAVDRGELDTRRAAAAGDDQLRQIGRPGGVVAFENPQAVG